LEARNPEDHTEHRRANQFDVPNDRRPKRTVILCAEGLFWRCHRRFVSDFVERQEFSVLED
jgi:uncharacterized protein (DUF488 family)